MAVQRPPGERGPPPGAVAHRKHPRGIAQSSSVITGDVRVTEPEHTPLLARESYLTLAVAGDDVRVTLDFDGDGLDALADAVTAAGRDE